MPTRCRGPCLLVAFALIIAGAVIIGVIPPLVHAGIAEAFKITNPAQSVYHAFVNSSAKGVEVRKALTLFSVVNPKEVHAGQDPQIKAYGPYVYREYETYNESAIYWLPNGTMRYKSFTVYEYLPEESTGDVFNDYINMPSFGLQAFFKMVHFYEANYSLNALEDQIANLIVDDVTAILLISKLKWEPFFTNQTAHAWIRGYGDNLINIITGLEKLPTESIGFLQDSVPSDFDSKGFNEMYTGGSGSPNMPPVPENSYKKMTMWRGHRQLPYWANQYANTINGTDATALAPFLHKAETVPVFVDTLFRSIWLEYEKEVEIKGVSCNRHVLKPTELQPGSQNGANYGFFMEYQGLLPAPPSKWSHPFLLSKPYFLDADRSVARLSDFPEANRDIHDTVLDFEPLTGSLFNVHKRLQASYNFTARHWPEALDLLCLALKQPILCGKSGHWFDADGIKSNVFPAFWIDQYMTLPDNLVHDFKMSVQLPLLLSKVCGGLAIAIGIVLIIACIVVHVLHVRREHRNRAEIEYFHLNGNNSMKPPGV